MSSFFIIRQGPVGDAPMNFTTGGSANWTSQTSEYHYDRDAAKSGTISHNQY